MLPPEAQERSLELDGSRAEVLERQPIYPHDAVDTESGRDEATEKGAVVTARPSLAEV
jgi:hypothetical protein